MSSTSEAAALLSGHVMQWGLAAQRQAKRCLDGSAQMADRANDAHLFAVALRNLLRAVEEAERRLGLCAIAAALAGFRSEVPNAATVRDVLEHFDDYEFGTGKHQKSGRIKGYVGLTWEAWPGRFVIRPADNLTLDVGSAAVASERLAVAVMLALDRYDPSAPDSVDGR